MAEIDAWMPLWIGDYLADTQELTTEEHGAYLLLLMTAWRNGGYLPSSPDRLARITKLNGKAWSETWKSLERFFVAVDGEMIVQKRLVEELTTAMKKKGSAAGAGRASAEARRKTFGSAQPSNASRTNNRTEPERPPNDTSNGTPNNQSNERSSNRSEPKSNPSQSPSESESEGGSGARPPARSQVWEPAEWLRQFGLAWTAKYQNFYGQAGDPKACATFADMLDRLPQEEILRCQSRAADMFAEFFAGTDKTVVARKHPFAFFVGDFGALRVSNGTRKSAQKSPALEKAAREWAGR